MPVAPNPTAAAPNRSEPSASLTSSRPATATTDKAGSSFLGSIYPWGGSSGRAATAAAPASGSTGSTEAGTAAAAGATSSGTGSKQDHITSSYYGRSIRKYPEGCPPLNVQWFHAVDVPKRKPDWLNGKKAPKDTKPLPAPKKFAAFSADDTRAIEAAYQKVLEELEDRQRTGPLQGDRRSRGGSDLDNAATAVNAYGLARSSGRESNNIGRGVKVPVNEDYLFDVDIAERELAPVYWLGPVYDVRRGSWFYQEGSNQRPCEENLAAQLEEGYLKAQPWLYPATAAVRTRSNSGKAGKEASDSADAKDSTKHSKDKPKDRDNKKEADSRSSNSPVKKKAKTAASGTGTGAGDVGELASGSLAEAASASASTTALAGTAAAAPAPSLQTHRLFGQYMNHVATYQDATVAWLSTDGMLSWVTSTMYEHFSGGGYMSGIKVVRGYSEPKKAAAAAAAAKDKDKDKDKDKKSTDAAALAEEKRVKALKRRSAPAGTVGTTGSGQAGKDEEPEVPTVTEAATATNSSSGRTLQRQLAALWGRNEPEKEEEELREREEQEIRDDYNAQTGETQAREIEHLILVTHGIGQLLGLRMESLNFIHDVNVLRKTLKSVYSASPNLRALNTELPDGPGNCRIQVLPVCWRHLLDFPRRSGPRKQEQDLTDISEEEDEYPSLDDITIEGMAFARSLISDLALDVLLYQSAYRQQIAKIVQTESNRIYRLYCERNPGFKGTVHIIGHSLGSAIMFDLLCEQREREREDTGRSGWMAVAPATTSTSANDLAFEFPVQDFYCLGSPIGLFQMLKGNTIGARRSGGGGGGSSSAWGMTGSGPEGGAASMPGGDCDQPLSPITGLPCSVSSPKVAQIYNIFHPSDPISYRLEPLIAPAMSALKPQALPYTKRSLFSSVAPDRLTGISAKVGQSVSGLWSSLSAGIASNLLNRSLGLSKEDVAKMEQQQQQQHQQHADSSAPESHGPLGSVGNPIVVDSEMETLFAHFQKKRAKLVEEPGDGGMSGSISKKRSDSSSHSKWLEEEAKAQRMRLEEAKVRALNRSGRVDYSIQESVLDFNPINTIASHMAYWADVDVNHFIMLQILSRGKPGKH